MLGDAIYLTAMFPQGVLGCAGAAFLIELIINRRPIVVSLVVPAIAFPLFLAWLFSISVEMDTAGMVAETFIPFMLPGFLAALIGAGTARGLRMMIELYQETSKTES